MSFLSLRDYQQEALNTVSQEFLDGVHKQLVVLPTGSGKTILMAAIAKRFNKRMLLVAHREELIQQAFEKFKIFWPDADIGICMAERDETDRQIVIGSVQSCSRPKRLEKLKRQGFDILMIDEAHHAIADSYLNIIDSLGFQEGKLLIGVTATPNRSDRQELGDVFEKVTFSRSISTMIKAGYLSPAIGRKILTNFILKNISSRHGDFVLEDLAEAVNTPERNAFIAERYKSHALDRKGIAFCVNVKHCQDLSAAFLKLGISSKAVWGEMPGEERRNVIEELKSGEVQVVTSCGVLTEGFDEPSINCIAMARPTKSHALYIQCVGRGLRLWPGKNDCLVLDFTDKSHNLDDLITLSTSIPEALQVREWEFESVEREIDRTAKIEIFRESDEEFDILGCARFMWVPIGDDEWSLMDDERKEIVISPYGDGFIAKLYFNETERSIVSRPLPLDYCSGVCEDYARRHLKIAFADMKAPWMNRSLVATQTQRDYLQKHDAYKEGMTKAEASLEIRRIVALKNKKRRQLEGEPLTAKQRFALRSRGINTRGMSKMRAIREISKIKQHEYV